MKLSDLHAFANRSQSKTGSTLPKDKNSARLRVLSKSANELIKQRPVFTPDMTAEQIDYLDHIDRAVMEAIREIREEANELLREKAKKRKLGIWYRTNQEQYNCYSQTFSKGFTMPDLLLSMFGVISIAFMFLVLAYIF